MGCRKATCLHCELAQEGGSTWVDPAGDLCFQVVLRMDSSPSVHAQEGIRGLDLGIMNTFQQVGKFRNTEFSKLRLSCPRETNMKPYINSNTSKYREQRMT